MDLFIKSVSSPASSDLRCITEMSVDDILKDTSPEPWNAPIEYRSRGYRETFIDSFLDEPRNLCVLSFKTSRIGKSTHFQRVNLRDFWSLYSSNLDDDSPLPLEELISLSLFSGDIEVFCSCPHWVFGGYMFMATKLDYAFSKKENRFPKRNNPRLQGTVCKHLYVVLNSLEANKDSIITSISKQLR